MPGNLAGGRVAGRSCSVEYKDCWTLELEWEKGGRGVSGRVGEEKRGEEYV